MDLSVGQSITFILFGIVMVLVLLKVLAMVHHQTNRVKELEMRMKAIETPTAVNEEPESTVKESEETNG